MSNTTTTTTVTHADATFYNKTLLKRAIPALVYERFGQTDPVALYSGDQPKWRLFNSLTAPTAPLTEGTTPSAQQLSVTDVTGQLETYGTFVELSDYIQFTANEGKKILTETSMLIGEALGNAKDQITRDAVAAGSSVYYANNVGGRDSVIAKLTATDLNKIIRALRANNAPFWVENPLVGTDKVGTQPIAPAYFGVVHPYTTYDLRAILTTNFVEVQDYPNPSAALPNEVGAYRNIRFLESTNAKIFADSGGSATGATLKYTTASSACDVYATMIFGRGAFGIAPLSGKSSEIIVKPLGAGDDALNQRSTIGGKFITDTVILNENMMYRYEHGVSA